MELRGGRPEPIAVLGRRHDTDKGTRHTYLDVYDQLLAHLRDKEIALLEVGVLGGGSLRLWREAFPRARVYGIDNDVRRRWGVVEGCTVLEIDACDRQAADAHFEDGSLDVVIDDGSHEIEEQLLTFGWYYPKLKPGGLYVVEDLGPEGVRTFSTLPLGAVVLDRREWRGVSDDALAIIRRPL